MFKLKFKVWDERKQKWSKEKFALLQDGLLLRLSDLKVCYPETHVPSFFTGYSASGKEIYTGDNIQYDYMTPPIEIKTQKHVSICGLNVARIIGNVFEHPEQLRV